MTTVLEFTAADMRNALTMVNSMKVVELKAVCRSMFLSTSGKKTDLQDKIKAAFMDAKNENNVIKLKTYDIIVKKVNNGDFSPRYDAIQASFTNRRIARALSTMEQTYPNTRSYNANHQQAINNQPKTYITSNSFAGRQNKSEAPWIWFVESPFYKLKKIIHNSPKMAYKAPQSRGTCCIDFVLNTQEQELLASGDQYQLYLFSAVFTKTDSSKKSFIQFPQPLEIHFNKNLIKENVKGIKNKPGTARPANLTKFVRQPPHNNSLEVVYAFSTENYLVYCYIVEVISPQKIADKIVKEHSHISKTATMESIKKDFKEQEKSDDLVELITTVSVKCPLTYTKMKYPARSITCDHLQCFDVLNYLQLQEQVPTWLCPICNNKIKSIDDISISDYMLDVVNNTNDEAEVVTLLHDGTWKAPDAEPLSSQNNSKDKTESKDEDESYIAESLDSDDGDGYDDLSLNEAAKTKQPEIQVQPNNAIANFFQQHSRPSEPPKNTYEGIEIISLDSDTEEENDTDTYGLLAPSTDPAYHPPPSLAALPATPALIPPVPISLKPLDGPVPSQTNNQEQTISKNGISDSNLDKQYGLISTPYSDKNGTYRERPSANRNDMYSERPLSSTLATSDKTTAESKSNSRESSVESTIDQWFEENINSANAENNNNNQMSSSNQNNNKSTKSTTTIIYHDTSNANNELSNKPDNSGVSAPTPQNLASTLTASAGLLRLPAISTSFLRNGGASNTNNTAMSITPENSIPAVVPATNTVTDSTTEKSTSNPITPAVLPLQQRPQNKIQNGILEPAGAPSVQQYQRWDSGWPQPPFIPRGFPQNSSNSTLQYHSLNVHPQQQISPPLQQQEQRHEANQSQMNNKSDTVNRSQQNNTYHNDETKGIPSLPSFNVGNSFMLRRDNIVNDKHGKDGGINHNENSTNV